MKVLLAILLGFMGEAFGYLPVLCSTNGGVCKIDALNIYGNKVMDNLSNYFYQWYSSYCRCICKITNQFWVKSVSKPVVPQTFFTKYVETPTKGAMAWLGYEIKPEEIQEEICETTIPLVIMAVLVVSCIVTIVAKQRYTTEAGYTTKLDTAAFDPESDSPEEEIIQPEVSNSKTKYCCDCRLLLGDGN